MRGLYQRICPSTSCQTTSFSGSSLCVRLAIFSAGFGVGVGVGVIARVGVGVGVGVGAGFDTGLAASKTYLLCVQYVVGPSRKRNSAGLDGVLPRDKISMGQSCVTGSLT